MKQAYLIAIFFPLVYLSTLVISFVDAPYTGLHTSEPSFNTREISLSIYDANTEPSLNFNDATTEPSLNINDATTQSSFDISINDAIGNVVEMIIGTECTRIIATELNAKKCDIASKIQDPKCICYRYSLGIWADRDDIPKSCQLVMGLLCDTYNYLVNYAYLARVSTGYALHIQEMAALNHTRTKDLEVVTLVPRLSGG